MREHVADHEQIHIAGDHFLLTKVENTGAFLSMGDDWAPWTKTFWLHVVPSCMMLGLGIWLFLSNIPMRMALGLCCIIGGGVGNILDRIAYGSSTDFLYINIGFFKTGIFNFADVSITFGALFIIALQILKSEQKPQ
ncbi:MAG TPA: signal peptidase II [Saprospirales bacterium]|nr:signal peptidase II [Saprospirales bacterium]